MQDTRPVETYDGWTLAVGHARADGGHHVVTLAVRTEIMPTQIENLDPAAARALARALDYWADVCDLANL